MTETIGEAIDKMTDQQLIDDFVAVHYEVTVAECFSYKDIFWLQAEGEELEKRGYEIQLVVNVVKKEVADEQQTQQIQVSEN